MGGELGEDRPRIGLPEASSWPNQSELVLSHHGPGAAPPAHLRRTVPGQEFGKIRDATRDLVRYAAGEHSGHGRPSAPIRGGPIHAQLSERQARQQRRAAPVSPRTFPPDAFDYMARGIGQVAG